MKCPPKGHVLNSSPNSQLVGLFLGLWKFKKWDYMKEGMD